MNASVVVDSSGFAATLDRLASELAEATTRRDGPLALVGIRTRGVPLSQRLASLVEAKTGARPALGALDITLYRDDLTDIASQPVVRSTDIPFPVNDAFIVLVDDVLFTGRTVRAAITALIDFGRPRKIELLAMVDRGWRELPIQPDYVGLSVTTTREQTVSVHIAPQDAADEVLLLT